MLKSMRIPLIVLTVCLLAAGQVWLSHLRVDVAQRVSKLKQERNTVKQEVQNLKLELASLMRPDTLRRLAREELGMRAPKPMQVIKP
ncbi:MAG: cell division protein FtsL [Ghiorsea sp.]